jgi:predicted nucleotidyltransferase
MDREHVIATLRQHEPELRAAGIVHLRLHGSLARAESHTSDVDLIAEFDPARHLSLLDMIGLENRLSDLLGAPVDLAPAHMLKRPIAQRAAHEAILAFLKTCGFRSRINPRNP